MSWFRVDDTFPDHPKVIGLNLNAVGLWLLCGAWSARQLTNGFIPSKIAHEKGGHNWRRQAVELVKAGLWVEVEGGYQMHEYLDRNPSKDQVEAKRAAAAQRQQIAREKRIQKRLEAVRGAAPDPEGKRSLTCTPAP